MKTLAALLVMLQAAVSGTYIWDLPKGFPPPPVPAGDPMTPEKVLLGRHLFYDTRMSLNGKSWCATCHEQELAFTNGRAAAIGTTGENHPRGAMSLVNIAHSASFTWNNPGMTELEQQAGFFLSVASPGATKPNSWIRAIWVGVVLLGLSMLVLGILLIRAAFH